MTASIPVGISIHAPRKGSDRKHHHHTGSEAISIHAPRKGSDVWSWFSAPGRGQFLSTLPARGATSLSCVKYSNALNFYPRSPQGERPVIALPSVSIPIFLSTLPARGATLVSRRPAYPTKHFYPRSPQGERQDRCNHHGSSDQFLSTLPARGATFGLSAYSILA